MVYIFECCAIMFGDNNDMGGGWWVVGWEYHTERALGLPEALLLWFTCFGVRKSVCFGKACGLLILDVVQ